MVDYHAELAVEFLNSEKEGFKVRYPSRLRDVAVGSPGPTLVYVNSDLVETIIVPGRVEKLIETVNMGWAVIKGVPYPLG